jgi:predicted flap endonuclease-1-like 5' DNA nuclease
LEEVRELLQEAGLQLVLHDSTAEDQPPGTVLGQIPLPGSEVEAGTSIYVAVTAPRAVIEPPGSVALIPGELKGVRGLLYFVAGILVILGITIVSVKVLKRKKPSDDKHPKDVELTKKSTDGEKIDAKSEIHFETFPDIGRQYIITKDVLIPREEEDRTAAAVDFAPAGKTGSPEEINLSDIEEVVARITELLKSSTFSTFGELEKALNFKIRLKAIPDIGKQYLEAKTPLILKEIGGFPAEPETLASVAASQSGDSGEMEDIREIGIQIEKELRVSKITTFAQLAAALKFKIGLKPFPVKGSLVAKDDLKRVEGIGPKISKLLRESGISSFPQLAATDVEHLREILNKADLPFTDPATWPEQAKLAAQGDWKALDTLQEKLKGGRRI